MEISLIIPAYNEEAAIGQCLETAIKNSHGKFKEIIVVDNASTDRTAEIARSYPGVTVVYEARKGTGNARQTGFENSNGEIVAYLDSDSHIPEDWVDKIEAWFADPQVVFLSGAYRYHDCGYLRSLLLDTIWWFSLIAYWMVGYVGNTGNCAMRASAMHEIGGFDRSILFYGDDTDIARRLHTVGRTIWSLNFYNFSSSRRFAEQGIFKTYFIYFLNYWWPVLFHRPYSPGHHDLKRETVTLKK
jgi:glycosyltransferase involved in cell wall biosynthesis